ncbi:hemerythrin domain-containing protein [Microterricola viridarii]|uniref:Hemerythrin HHE cation binding domain-containing protein n=1 Tax=Microterricola viridarii TaxID=412690 RepID=A0A1H1Y339_9MICO|nr:hemerythrin domain-containing protein [Microterricola viridarii]SDT15845.1 Hemerythrin HHE cation binding domain-containing protein [Microterricola viridarii]
MPATALPSNGDQPEPAGGTKSCDASGMAEIHRMFRAGFGEGAALIRGVREGDAAHADRVGQHLANLSTGLHGHHEGEDTLLWDRLEERAPACTVHVERMRRQHAEMLVHLTALDVALPRWRLSGRAADVGAVTEALTGINAALAVHLPDEETTVVPVMEHVLAQDEVEALAEHGRKSAPKGAMFTTLGMILAAQPDGGAEWQRKHLPAPARLIWRTVGARKYARYRASLVG